MPSSLAVPATATAQFKILGAVRVVADGQQLPPLAPRHSALLGYLLLHARTVLSADRLAAAMWEETAPDTARAQIQAAVTARAQQGYLDSLYLYQQLGDRFGEAIVLGNLGIIYALQGHYDRAEQHIRRALRAHQAMRCRGDEATQLGNLGLFREQQKQYEHARGHYRQALDLYRKLGYRSGEAEMLNCLAEVARATGELPQAEEDHTSALAVALEAGSLAEEARALHGLAHVEAKRGDTGPPGSTRRKRWNCTPDWASPKPGK